MLVKHAWIFEIVGASTRQVRASITQEACKCTQAQRRRTQVPRKCMQVQCKCTQAARRCRWNARKLLSLLWEIYPVWEYCITFERRSSWGTPPQVNNQLNIDSYSVLHICCNLVSESLPLPILNWRNILLRNSRISRHFRCVQFIKTIESQCLGSRSWLWHSHLSPSLLSTQITVCCPENRSRKG